MKNYIAAMIAALLIAATASAAIVKVKLNSGATITGELISLDPTCCVSVQVGSIPTSIDMSEVASIETVDASKGAVSTDSDLPAEKIVNIAGLDVKFKLVKGGTFSYGFEGDGSRRIDSEPVHNVTLSAFYMSEEPVKAALVERIMGTYDFADYTIVIKNKKPAGYKKLVNYLTPQPAVTESNRDVAFLSLADKESEIFDCYFSNIPKNVCTVKTFVTRLNQECPGMNFDIPTETQWSYVYFYNPEVVTFHFLPEACYSVSMNESTDPHKQQYMLKGLEGVPALRWFDTQVPMHANRVTNGIVAIKKKQKELRIGPGQDLVAPLHLVMPAK